MAAPSARESGTQYASTCSGLNADFRILLLPELDGAEAFLERSTFHASCHALNSPEWSMTASPLTTRNPRPCSSTQLRTAHSSLSSMLTLAGLATGPTVCRDVWTLMSHTHDSP